MKGGIDVISAGLFSTIQDTGRPNFRKYGVPVSGYMDRQSATLANHLLNNDQNAALIEITLTGPKLYFQSSTDICITGADISPALNDRPVQLNQPMYISKNSILTFGALRFGARAYLAIKGGCKVEEIMGSRSYYSPVTPKNSLQKGDCVPIFSHETISSFQSNVKVDRSLFDGPYISCSRGPEFDLLSNEAQHLLVELKFTVTNENNRMGYRLLGDSLNYPANYNMLTSAVLPGTVQLTPSGQLIVLMQDCQTTGGYPRVLQLTQNGINRLAQKKTGDIIQFTVQK